FGDLLGLTPGAEDAPVVKLLQTVFEEAMRLRASDIHFEPQEKGLRIRFRIDGVLHIQTEADAKIASAVALRLKLMSGLDISEKRLPQDGRFNIKVRANPVDVRISTLPTQYGESVVMRLLNQNTGLLGLDKVGMPERVLERFRHSLKRPSGMVLVTGPTGSGKTTTLYACLNELNQVGVKIITTEDPVELQIDRLVQVQVREEVGLTFAACLRSILRQDPDIVMVGEIRDLETAQIAVEASLTGHLVLSTLHTNSAPETITRLLDMDLEPFLITSSLEAVLAQRLVRTVCRHCRKPYRPEEKEMELLGLPDAWRKDANLRFWRPDGCPACDYIGYMGRVGLFELLLVDETLCEMIQDRAMSYDIRKYARSKLGMKTLREEGIIKCAQGITTVDEVLAHTDKFEDDQ
ncbi:MAG: type II/IV secretion system protein, partial [Candidatus Hydrogenedentes bacterium]|nr:type II/IV secretion system protein [Candidatus Hydrogenedentota bacterium]